MKTMSVTEARRNFYRLIQETEHSHQPILITNKQNNAVMLAESDWRAIQETLYLLSVPGLRDSVLKGMATAIEDCASELEW